MLKKFEIEGSKECGYKFYFTLLNLHRVEEDTSSKVFDTYEECFEASQASLKKRLKEIRVVQSNKLVHGFEVVKTTLGYEGRFSIDNKLGKSERMSTRHYNTFEEAFNVGVSEMRKCVDTVSNYAKEVQDSAKELALKILRDAKLKYDGRDYMYVELSSLICEIREA